MFPENLRLAGGGGSCVCNSLGTTSPLIPVAMLICAIKKDWSRMGAENQEYSPQNNSKPNQIFYLKRNLRPLRHLFPFYS